MDKAGKRIEVLLDWRDQVVAAGHAAPSAPDVMRIGASGEVRPDGAELDEVAPWAETIAYLLKQLKFGVNDPVSHMPEDLMSPAPGAPSRPQTGPGDREDPVFTALLAWWKAEQTSDPRLRALKAHQLRNIATAGSRTETAIRRHLPGSLGFVARQLAEVIARVPSAGSTSAGSLGAGSVSAGSVSEAAAGSTSEAPTTAAAGSDGPVGSHARQGSAPRHAQEPTTAGAERPEDAELAALELADWLYTPIDRPVGAVRRRSGPHGIVLTWPRAEPPEQAGTPDSPDPTVLYRVVSSDSRFPPEEPQSGDPLTVTEAVRCVDARPFRGPVRHVQVWRHSGRDRATAAAAEPVLHAEAVLVAQVSDARIVEDGGSVVGRWRVPQGVAAVEVLRVPIGEARREGHSGPEFRLRPMRPYVTGFVDDQVLRGQTYVYEVSVEVELEGSTLRSDPVKVEVAVPAVLEPVTDLQVLDYAADAGSFDLRWSTPPGGEVLVYRTQEPPTAGIEDRRVEVAVLPQARLPEEAVVGRPKDEGPEGSTMAGVPWPTGWTTAYLTPVTLLDGMAAVGPSVLVQRPAAVRGARIVERTQTQVLTFAWPDGADKVLAYLGGPNQHPDSVRRGRPLEISQDQYVRYGGMYYPYPLPPRGCSVHLVPVAFNHGRVTWGPTTSLAYPGLLRVHYSVRVERAKGGVPFAVTLWIRAQDADHPTAPPFTMVLNPERLPLDEHDGRPLDMQPSGDPVATGGTQFRPSALRADPGDALWTARVDGLTGFLRLFACLPTDRPASMAVLDPPVNDLFLFPRPPS